MVLFFVLAIFLIVVFFLYMAAISFCSFCFQCHFHNVTQIYISFTNYVKIFSGCVSHYFGEWRYVGRVSCLFVLHVYLFGFLFYPPCKNIRRQKRVSISFNFRSTQTDYSSLSKYGPLNRCEQEVVRRGQLMPLAL